MSRRSWETKRRAWRTSNRCCHRSRCRGRSAVGWLVAAGLAVSARDPRWSSGMRRRKRRPIEPRRQTPEEIAQAALALLLAENLPGRGLVKEFYLRLTGIVRQYVEDTTGIRAPEQTTEEFLRDMRSRAVFPPERSGPARGIPGSGRPGQVRRAAAGRGSDRPGHRAGARVRQPEAVAGCRDGRRRRD